ncbi:MAG TPA: c-type cytochrome biogenesis protein CcsB [Syntrophobacteraceae bacterium]|nr:c-type cytochrome biogenesis protein CcsB [Syntrophobacteraceae bacterium]
MRTILFVMATGCYLLGTIGYMIYLARNLPQVHWIAWAFLALGCLAHGGGIVCQSLEAGHLAVTTSQEALSFFAWMLVATYLLVQLRLNLRILGSFVSPLAVIFMLASSVMPASIVPRSGIFQSAWVVLHVTALFVANAVFALAFSAGVMYLLQERQIKQKHFGFLYRRLPSLERLDVINSACLMVGFPLMTLGLLAGLAYANMILQSAWLRDPKVISALVTWCIYAMSVHQRLAIGWRGRRAAWLAILGFSAILVTFLGVNLLLKSYHTHFVM